MVRRGVRHVVRRLPRPRHVARQRSAQGTAQIFGPELIWEIPVAFGMAFIGQGVASHFGVPQPASTGLIAVLSYLGPRGTEVMLQKWVSRKTAV